MQKIYFLDLVQTLLNFKCEGLDCIFFLFQQVEDEIKEATRHEDVRENRGIESAAGPTIENISLNENATEENAKPKRAGVHHNYAFYQF